MTPADWLATLEATWISGTGVSSFILDSGWIWPAGEVLHFVGLSVLLGVAGVFDLRLMGLFRGVPFHALRGPMPWAMAAFAANVITGSLFFLGKPFQYIENPAFGYKLMFLALAGTNALIFETMVARPMLNTAAGAAPPVTARVIGAVSLFSWLAVLYRGRMLAFLGEAF